MTGTLLHVVFDIAAWVAAGLAFVWLTRWSGVRFPASRSGDLAYMAALLFGAGVGAFAFGTANLWLSHQAGVARSIEGAIAGGILAVELYKRGAGITARTGARFALPLAVGVAVGRIGCYFAGINDFTYGTPTTLPWGHDFGDSTLRHPVQLYESATMAAFALVYVLCVLRQNAFVIENGFYLAVGFYGLQRFVWEFIKPYGTLIGPFTLFHVLSAAIVAYAVVMIATAPTVSRPRSVDDHAVA
jgi:phosphatidylglycerol---prolipoprotein diacylglyceryl transferase